MNIIFLDYDGVVNTLMFDGKSENPYFNFPKDNKVNNYQAICWLNKLCKEYDAKIVVISTWREQDNYKECLYNGGLDKNIEIIGKTESFSFIRGEEIQKWLDDHKDTDINFVILDDDANMGELEKYRVKTETYRGFDYYEYEKARLILNGILFWGKEE